VQRPFGRETTLLREVTITVVINHFQYPGMSLQVEGVGSPQKNIHPTSRGSVGGMLASLPPKKKLSLIGSREFSSHLEPTNHPKKIHLNFRAIPSEKPCMLNELHFLILKKPFGRRKQKGKEHVDQEYDIPFTLSILTPQNWLC